jgi:anti-anti-sigma factor
MGEHVDDRSGDDATGAWLDAAERAELGDLTSTVHARRATAVSVESEAGVSVVRVDGELATGSAAYLDVVLEQVIGAAPGAVLVDLSGAGFIGVRGIATLVRAAGRAAGNRTALCVVAPMYVGLTRNLRALDMTGLFDVHRSVADCRSALADRAPSSPSDARSRSPACARPARSGRRPGDQQASDGPDMRIVVESAGDVVLVRLSGPLSLRTVGSVAAALAKPLIAGGRVVADLSEARLLWEPALQVFPSTLGVVGGWPTARLVLLDPDHRLTAAVRALRIDLVVPLAHALPDARALLERAPAIVLRYHDLPHETGSPRRARALLRSACSDWRIEALAADAQVVATELVTNVVQHARTSCRLIVRLDDTALRISVRDHEVADDATLQRLHSAPTLPGGLGTVAGLTRIQGVTPHSDGKTIWAAIDLDRSR